LLTAGDITASYELIGYNEADIGIPPEDAPADYILDLHKRTFQAAVDQHERVNISNALAIIGKEREDRVMVRLARWGETFLSVDDAYAALGAPRESTDEGLIMCVTICEIGKIADLTGSTI